MQIQNYIYILAILGQTQELRASCYQTGVLPIEQLHHQTKKLNKKFKEDENKTIQKSNKNKNQRNLRGEQSNDQVEKLDNESQQKTHLCGRNCELS